MDRFGPLQLRGQVSTTRDVNPAAWQDNVECFLFDKILLLSVEKDGTKRALKGSVRIHDMKGIEMAVGRF